MPIFFSHFNISKIGAHLMIDGILQLHLAVLFLGDTKKKTTVYLTTDSLDSVKSWNTTGLKILCG